MQFKDPTLAVVLAIGSALVVLFAGAGATLAAGQQVPTALWAAASALSGALVGMLVPPGTGGTVLTQAAAQAARAETQNSAIAAAEETADQLSATAERSGATKDKAAADAAADALNELQRQVPRFATLELAARQAALSPEAAAATAAAATVGAAQQAAADAAAAERQADQAQQAAEGQEASPQVLAKATGRRQVLDAAVSGAIAGQSDSIATGVKAADAARPRVRRLRKVPNKLKLQWKEVPGKVRVRWVDMKVVLTLLVSLIAFAIGIWLALKTGKQTTANATEYDAAVKDAADTLIALGSAAAGAALGFKAPPRPTDQNG